ncbi:MAG: response regulator [Gemmatimonadaceae bacterium]
MMASLDVLIVEDDVEDYEIARDLLSSASSTRYNVDWARRYDEGLAAAISGSHDVVLVDYDLRGASGVDLVRAALHGGSQAAMILLTGHSSLHVADEAQSAGFDDFISKSSLTAELLERTMRYAIERRRAHEDLRESETKYRALFKANPVPTWVTAVDDGQILAVNDAAVEQYGYTREEFLALRGEALEAPRHLATTARVVDYPEAVPVLHRRKDDSLINVDILLESVRFEGRRAMITLARDITESVRAHIALRESEERFRELAAHVAVAFFVYDPEGNRPIYLSPAYERVFDQPVAEALSRPHAWLERVHPDDRHRTLVGGRTTVTPEAEFRVIRQDGSTRWIRRRAEGLHGADGRLRRIVGTAEDITDLRRAQQQAEATSKMEAIGRLAGGVAHDFNNMLTAILGEADLLKEELGSCDERVQGVDEIRSAALRAADLTRQLLAFGRQQMFELQVLDLETLAGGLEKMLRRLIGEDVDLRILAEPFTGPILADASQVQQIIVNLTVNARDAMPDGGTLTIETNSLEVDDEFAARHAGLRPGSYTTLSVRDVGIGMSDDVKSRIFEPFYTTKERGQGTGLGLATVYGIVKQSNGYIIVDSRPGAGTTFTVCFPRVTADVDAPAEIAPGTRSAAGTETILVVEDEEGVRTIISRVLSRHGYTVLPARSGADALAVCHGYEGDIHAVLSDVVMPGMSGPATIAVLRDRRPRLKVLFMSGYTDRQLVEQQRAHGGVGFLQKPFMPDALLETLRRTLDAD